MEFDTTYVVMIGDKFVDVNYPSMRMFPTRFGDCATRFTAFEAERQAEILRRKTTEEIAVFAVADLASL